MKVKSNSFIAEHICYGVLLHIRIQDGINARDTLGTICCLHVCANSKHVCKMRVSGCGEEEMVLMA